MSRAEQYTLRLDPELAAEVNALIAEYNRQHWALYGRGVSKGKVLAMIIRRGLGPAKSAIEKSLALARRQRAEAQAQAAG